MILALLLAQASAVDAERAFAADARKLGQWTAFRKWAADDAMMFDPQPINVHEKLKEAPDPPKPVEWRPARSFVSCDGTMAANTGPWRRPDGSFGYFSTIWLRQPGGGWKWTVDHGDVSRTPKFAWDAQLMVRRAACSKKNPLAIEWTQPDEKTDGNRSDDGTLQYFWAVTPDGVRRFRASIWTGRRFELVIDDRVAAPPAP